jgi:hypothetical protein
MNVLRFLVYSQIAILAAINAVAAAPGSSYLLEDFEIGSASNRWTFSNGPEFPGAKGSFKIAAEAAHPGRSGGKLTFDFTGGGNYVSAVLHIPESGRVALTNWNALQFWVNCPAGSSLGFRYTDVGGQTFQKPIECAAGAWTQVTVAFQDWASHWGGANDGVIHGPPITLALNVEHEDRQTGAVFFDDLRLVNYQPRVVNVSYSAFQFSTEEGWAQRAEGNAGSTHRNGKTWSLDFSQGARSLGMSPPDHVLLGNVDRIHIRARGNAIGHPVRLVLHTHFMTFQKVIGEFQGDGDQELVTAGPPSPGWEWHSGENDGKLHGPLRFGEIQLLGNGHTNKCEIELVEVGIDGSCPAEKRLVLLADLGTKYGRPTLLARARALGDQPIAGEMVWSLRDWEGRTLSQGRQRLTVPAKAEPVEFALPMDDRDMAAYKYLEGDMSLEVPGQEVAPVKAAWTARLDDPRDADLKPESPFGMGVYLNRYGGDAAGLQRMERAAKAARDAGVKWTREDFSWGRIEPQRGKFDWRFYDDLVACAKRNGITVYGIAGYWAPWTKPYTEEGIDDYLKYLRAMVGHYRDDIKYWEIWNEPNIFFWQGPKETYAKLISKSYAVIREVDPEAKVLGLSTAGVDMKFIEQMLALNAPFDILTIHPYRKKLDDLGFINELQKVSDMVRLPNGKRRPVWLTEMGWATHTPHNTLRQDFAPTSLRAQAELIARTYLCAIVSGIEPRTFWYDFRNDGDDPIYFEHQMGIVNSDFRPKPAYVAYATLTRVLQGKIFDRHLDLDKGVLAYLFKSEPAGKGGVIALWSPGKDVVVDVPIEAERVTRVNTIGERIDLRTTGNRLKLELKAGAVVYLVLP